jgi:uncharacterized membrane protein
MCASASMGFVHHAAAFTLIAALAAEVALLRAPLSSARPAWRAASAIGPEPAASLTMSAVPGAL